MLDGIMIFWFILTALSLLFAIYDLSTNTPVSWVQKLAWILVIAYTGPFGLFVFLLACRNPGKGLHATFTRANWKQGVNSEMHCLAGDATGIILCAIILSFFSLTPGVDLILEYVSAWIIGLFIFQALMMLDMFGNNYLRAVRKTIFVETVSMNMVMVGMIPVMVVLLHQFPESDDPGHPSFWFRMSMGAVVGGLTGFPINWWLVARGLKHGCMTVPEKDATPVESSEHSEHASHQVHEHHDSGMDHEHMDMSGDMHGCHGMQMATLPIWQQIAWILGTFILLGVAVWITTLFAPIRF